MGKRSWFFGAILGVVAGLFAIPGGAGASSGGPGLTLEPSSGACDATISVHATGLDVGQQIYLFAAPSAGDSAPVLLTYGPTVASTWDFTLPAGARFLCDEFAQPAMRIELSTGVTQAGEPTGVLATADFTQTAPDAAPSGPQIKLTPYHGDCDSPVSLDGSGFPPNTPVELVLGPLFSLPGSGGGGAVLLAPTTSADGQISFDLTSETRVPVPIGVPGTPLFTLQCRAFPRLLVTIGASRDASGGRATFAPASAVFREDVAHSAAAPGVGSAGPQHSDSHAVWFYAASAVLLLIAVGALAWVVTNSDEG